MSEQQSEDQPSGVTLETRTGTPQRVRVNMPGELVLQTDILIDDAEHFDDVFTLRSEAPAYEAQLNTKNDNVGTRDFVVLHFQGLPKNGVFTLEVRTEHGIEGELFKNVPFRELETLLRG